MAIDNAWLDLHRSRFPELPLDCGNRRNPGVIDGPDLRDWSGRETTPDQYRIEAYVDRFDLKTKRILHIGIGCSGLARRFHRRAGEIVGTSIDEPEIEIARSLALPNYRAVEENKYFDRHNEVTGKFDFIIDNNLTSACCCIHHLAQLFAFFNSKLADGGQIVTDSEGLGWIPPGSNARWSFDFDDLAAVATAARLSAYRMSRTVYVVAREEPPKPQFLPVLRHSIRRMKFLPEEIIRWARGAASAASELVWAKGGTEVGGG